MNDRASARLFNPNNEDPRSFGRLIINVQLIVFFAALGITIFVSANKTVTLWLAAILAVTVIFSLFRIYWPAQLITPLSILSISAIFMYEGNGAHDIAMVGLVGGITIGGLFLGARGLMGFGLLAILTYTGFATAEISGFFTPEIANRTIIEEPFVFAFLTGAISLSLWTLVNRLRQIANQARESEKKQADINLELTDLKNALEHRVAERTAALERRVAQFETISSIARSITAMQDLEQLLPFICQVVSQQFGFYHTGIFLLDERAEYAVLRSANSEGGRRMLARGHRLRVGASGIVGLTAAQGEARIALDVGADAVYFNNPDLPDTRSEMSLPLKIGGQTIGALDVQSREKDAFNEEDIAVLGILANQISVAIENTRLFSKTAQALTESQGIYQQYVANDWARFSQTAKHHGYAYDGLRVSPLENQSIIPAIGSVSLPIKIRGLTIGNVILQSPNPSRQWTQDEINLAQAAAERAGLAIENFRLLTEAQRRAAKERAIGEITSRIGSSANLREIMETAVEELARAMPGSEIMIQFDEGNS